MRDLYSRLGVPRSASDRQVREAISACRSATLRDNANEVLLVPGRRQNYDRVHAVLTDIGALRAQLGLNYGGNWRSPESDDFTKDSSNIYSAYDSLIAKINQTNTGQRSQPFEESRTNGPARMVWFVVVFLGLAGLVLFFNSASLQSAQPVSSHSEGTGFSELSLPSKGSDSLAAGNPTESEFSAPELVLPANGDINWHTSAIRLAPLNIRTSAGTNYLVKLKRVSDDQSILDVFIRGGSDFSVDVPLGQYYLEYAAGQKWYGHKHYFGPETGYSRADSTFNFYQDAYGVSGYTVTLYQVANGNLRTVEIPPESF